MNIGSSTQSEWMLRPETTASVDSRLRLAPDDDKLRRGMSMSMPLLRRRRRIRRLVYPEEALPWLQLALRA